MALEPTTSAQRDSELDYQNKKAGIYDTAFGVPTPSIPAPRQGWIQLICSRYLLGVL